MNSKHRGTENPCNHTLNTGFPNVFFNKFTLFILGTHTSLSHASH